MKRVHEGLGVLLKYDPHGACSAQHDVIYASGFSPDGMAQEDCDKLEELGWNWDEGEDSWRFFT